MLPASEYSNGSSAKATNFTSGLSAISTYEGIVTLSAFTPVWLLTR
jgi:hypothetical protein